MVELLWFILGACAMLAALLIGFLFGLSDSPFYDDHYVD